MLTKQERERLDIWLMQELKGDYDLFDSVANIDSSLSFDENKSILAEKIQYFKERKTEYNKKQLESMQQEHQDMINCMDANSFKGASILLDLFQSPKIIGICADKNSGKSNLIYFLIKSLQQRYDFKLYSYGLRVNLGEQKIYSIEEMEKIKNSILFADEFFTLFDLEDRKKRHAIESTLRLIFHNNNILVLCGLPDNFKKYLSSNLDVILYKHCTISNFINGSTIKNVALNYRGSELGSSVLNIEIDKCLLFDGAHYKLLDVPYLEGYDTKKKNVEICVLKSVSENVVKGDLNA